VARLGSAMWLCSRDLGHSTHLRTSALIMGDQALAVSPDTHAGPPTDMACMALHASKRAMEQGRHWDYGMRGCIVAGARESVGWRGGYFSHVGEGHMCHELSARLCMPHLLEQYEHVCHGSHSELPSYKRCMGS
jgi:hypothetical protein